MSFCYAYRFNWQERDVPCVKHRDIDIRWVQTIAAAQQLSLGDKAFDTAFHSAEVFGYEVVKDNECDRINHLILHDSIA